MFSSFARLFRQPAKPAVPTIQHPDLGEMEYLAAAAEWQTTDASRVFHGGIRGDGGGPDSEAVAEILQRLERIDGYWDVCADDLLYIASCYSSLPKVQDPRELYRVSALSLYDGYWEVCFETHAPHKWLYVGMQFEDEQLVSNTIDT